MKASRRPAGPRPVPAGADRRVRRTRRELREALLALVRERGWAAVSVRDVCERADVARSTFYVHFADKEDLLLSGFDDLLAGLLEHRRRVGEPFAFAEPLFRHAAENVDLFRAVAGRESEQQIQWRFRDVVRALVDEELAETEPAGRATVVRFVAGGFVELLASWLDDGKGGSPSRLAAAFQRLARAAIEGAISGR